MLSTLLKGIKRNLTTHTLKGINGYSALNYQTIDVSKVVKTSWFKRSFCIFEEQYPYVLEIEYEEEEHCTSFFPMFLPITPFIMIPIPINHYNDTQIITKRYKSYNDLRNDVNEIETKRTQDINDTNGDCIS